MFRNLLLFLVLGASVLASDLDRVDVADSKTSIYIGNVTLELSPLLRDGTRFKGDYRAKVFPYFFMGERGSFFIDLDGLQLEKILTGERVEFRGEGLNTADESRRVEGYAQADAPGSRTGKIKVRIFVSKKIELIFNTQYRLP